MRGQANTTESAVGNPMQFLATTTTGATSNNTPALPANPKRSYAVLFNTDPSIDVYLCRGNGARAGYGILLRAGGGSYEILATNHFKGPIYAVTATGTAMLSIEEDV